MGGYKVSSGSAVYSEQFFQARASSVYLPDVSAPGPSLVHELHSPRGWLT